MNFQDRPPLTVESLLAMRSEPDAVRVITERLGVKDMGPADHIRTKHEVKAFVETGDKSVVLDLISRSAERLANSRKLSLKYSQARSERP